LAGLTWLSIGLLSETGAVPADELRCTFLAVGHGGCTVLETPDGRTLLYDAGSLGGPEVTRRQIAPYLWHRGIRRLDEVFLSHGDLDHFNGLNALLERFAIGQVTYTPTFPNKDTPAIRMTLDALEKYGVKRRVVHAGDRLEAGEVQFEVLHPPAIGPEGNENARSMVLLIHHVGHSFLLTGDLEGPGLARVLALPPVPVDVFMAPHHGSRFPNTPQLAQWARPKVVVSCEGLPRGPVRPAEPYTPMGAAFLGTWPHGAITVRSHATGLVVETFQTRLQFVVRPHHLSSERSSPPKARPRTSHHLPANKAGKGSFGTSLAINSRPRLSPGPGCNPGGYPPGLNLLPHLISGSRQGWAQLLQSVTGFSRLPGRHRT
jgi:competence protein ComEC